MCVVSNIMDGWRDSSGWPKRFPQNAPNTIPTIPLIPTAGPTREEFDALKKELEALKDLLKAAKIYDEKTGQKDCEMEEKIALFRQLAKLVGLDIDDLFPEKSLQP